MSWEVFAAMLGAVGVWMVPTLAYLAKLGERIARLEAMAGAPSPRVRVVDFRDRPREAR